MKVNNLEELFELELRDAYDFEQQLVKALPKMAKAASSQELRTAFEQHLAETERQVTRLESVFDEIGRKAKAQTCEAMEGLIKEGKDIIALKGDAATRDAGLIAAAQKVEHYEIATYGCLVTWARQLGRSRAAEMLQQALDEEKEADHKLNTIAESHLNAEAMAAR
jgi:ferritin-like metal-binding protein YciE